MQNSEPTAALQAAASHPIQFIRENWTWLAPAAYVYVTIVGMVQSWFHFRRFGINVFEHSELNDFLLAAFREPVALLLVVGMAMYGALGVLASRFFARRFSTASDTASPSRAKTIRFNQVMGYVSFGLTVVAAPVFGPVVLDNARSKGKIPWSDPPASETRVQIKDLTHPQVTGGWITFARVVGQTSKFVFVQLRDGELLIVPIGNIVAIAHVRH
jgi:hypothetical protein